MSFLLAAGAVAAALARPGDFTTRIDNPYFPLKPGTRQVYRETDAEGHELSVVVRVTRRTKRVASGIRGRVVRDTVTEDGELVEDTFDWYAQDREGNVWYLGERTTEYEDGKPVSTAGSFEDGVDGAGAASSCSPGRGWAASTRRSALPASPRTAPGCSAATSRSRWRQAISGAS